MAGEAGRRPVAAVVAGVVLLLMALASALVGIAGSWASNCCGSAEASDPLPAVLGLGVAALLSLAAFGLIGGWMRPGLLIAITAVVPVACLAAAPTSSDLGNAVPLALAGWGGLAWLLTRPVMAGWLTGGRDRELGHR